ncbi:MAG: carbohydrate kinase [Bacteroidales bacterium]|nr:carbohydrate kinase [Bacteroidales bacterium]
MKPLVCGIGECLWDKLENEKKPGGAPMNFAYHVGQLLGMDNSIAISSVGNDVLGKEIVEEYDSVGLRHSLAVDPIHCTGVVEVKLKDNGIPDYDIVENVAWDYIPFSLETKQMASKCRAVCFGTLAQRSEFSRTSINSFLNMVPKDCLIIFDVNLRGRYYTKEIIENSMRKCTIMKLNEEELPVVCQLLEIEEGTPEERCRKMMELWCIDTVIYTCGAHGSFIFTMDETSYRDTPKVNLVDTVGAGDSFTAAYCAAILKGWPLDKAHQLAVDVSAYVCTKHGAMPKLHQLS